MEYGKLTPYLVEAIKEQQTIIDQQMQHIADLETRMAKLERLLSEGMCAEQR